MKTLIVLALCVVAVFAVPPLHAQGKPMKVKQVPGKHHFILHTHEEGVLVQKKAKVDQGRKLVSYYVPQQNHVNESEFIHDYKNNLTVMIFPKQKVCYVTPLDKTEVQDPDTTITALKEAEKDGDMPVAGIQTSDYRIEGAPQKPESLLPDDLIPKCRNFATFRAKKMTESFSVDKKVQFADGSRKKREIPAFPVIEGDSCNMCMKPECIVQTRHCQFTVICQYVTNKFGEIVEDCSKNKKVHKFYNVNQCKPCCDMNHQVYFPPMPEIGYPGGNIVCSKMMANKAKSSYPNCRGQ
ncbi:uncharacterized protein LOC112041227 [Lingula anatina]|uniref:Uncharacterized protein LOC112041227 n=1 Tax=Lingula anatina TaxID=7574 RepID=A0A2R2MR05_LINAN|nr:uncharacterized protein LOC112041227 [Lingula anatina]|eukprot:XP_023932583.1 uncharacterized protein LOC112041227 [Lingula anatina]